MRLWRSKKVFHVLERLDFDIKHIKTTGEYYLVFTVTDVEGRAYSMVMTDEIIEFLKKSYPEAKEKLLEYTGREVE